MFSYITIYVEKIHRDFFKFYKSHIEENMGHCSLTTYAGDLNIYLKILHYNPNEVSIWKTFQMGFGHVNTGSSNQALS
jgi:hypothetical protein